MFTRKRYKPIYIAETLDYPVPDHTGPSVIHGRYVCLYIWESYPSYNIMCASLLNYGIVPWNKLCKFWNCRCAGWCAYDRLMFWDVACHVPWCCITIYDVLWRYMIFYNLLGCCTYCANNWGGCMSVDVYINIVYIVPTLGGVICKLLFSLVLSISCQQLWGCG